MSGSDRLSVVTVVFDAEYDFLVLQATSLRAYLAPEQLGAIHLIDNGDRPLSRRQRQLLLDAYGPLADRVSFVRPSDLGAIPPASGWVTQQVLKLLIAQRIQTTFFLVLDAKNHLIRPTGFDAFVNPDGRARGARHEYTSHPLRPSLEHVLTYLDVDPRPWLASFPVTHTPVVLETEHVRSLIAGLETRSGRSFAEEFVAAGLTEFFLYAGWLIAEHGGLDRFVDGTVIRSCNVWPGHAGYAAVVDALEESERLQSPFLSVHRKAMFRLNPAALRPLLDFWVARGLFAGTPAAAAFVVRCKLRYLRTTTQRKLRSSLRQVTGPGQRQEGARGADSV